MALFRARLDDEVVQEHLKNGTLAMDDLTTMNRMEDPSSFPVTGFFFGISAAHGIRMGRAATFQKLPAPTRFLLSKPAFAVAGAYLGHLYAQRYARKKIEGLQNPEGYKKAILDIHKVQAARNGEELVHVNWTYGIMIGHRIPKNRPEGMEEGIPQPEKPVETEEEAMMAQSTTPNDEQQVLRQPRQPVPPPPQNAPAQSTAPSTRWDEIRKEKSTAQPTAWDVIRQKYERERLPASVPTSSPQDEQGSNGWGGAQYSSPTSTDEIAPDDRKDEPSEQDRFDALLEAERRRSADADASQLFGESVWKESTGSSSSRRWR